MILVQAIFGCLVLSLFLKKDLTFLTRLPFYGGWKLGAAVAGLFGMQAGLVIFVPGQHWSQWLLLLATQMTLVGLCLLNRHLPGAKLFALGVLLNSLVMAANGGWMPIDPATYQLVRPSQAATLYSKPLDSKNIILPRHETRLWLLSDAIPINLPWRRTAMSVGDILLVLGVANLLWRLPRRRADSSQSVKVIHRRVDALG